MLSKNLSAKEELLNFPNLKKDCIKEAFISPNDYPHRLKRVGEYNNIIFVDDSWATTVNATWYSLELIQNKIIWIMGGMSNGNDYSPLVELVYKKVVGLICLDISNEKVASAFAYCEIIVNTNSIINAVDQAIVLAKPGQTVLFSPACKVLPELGNYCTRGEMFKQAVMDRI